MKKSLKGFLLSGLVYPGLGQILCKKYARGIVLLVTVSAALIAFVVSASLIAVSVLDDIRASGEIIDMDTITKTATQVSHSSDNFIMNASLLLMIVLWIVGMIDAYIVGREIDKHEMENH